MERRRGCRPPSVALETIGAGGAGGEVSRPGWNPHRPVIGWPPFAGVVLGLAGRGHLVSAPPVGGGRVMVASVIRTHTASVGSVLPPFAVSRHDVSSLAGCVSTTMPDADRGSASCR